MRSELGTYSNGAAIVVTERAWVLNLTFGFLAWMFAIALVRGHLGATTTAGRVGVDVLFGALLAATIGAWLRLRRHPARIEISSEAITLSYRGGKSSQRLLRTSGDLYVRYAGGKYPRLFLCISGAAERLPLWTFDPREVAHACITNGWRFADPR